MTNGDKIRQMSNEELAEKINNEPCSCDLWAYNGTTNCHLDDCEEGIKAYLDMEIQEWINKIKKK